jgi:cation diffusion facilitator CzcD-associated flavoprotein CzcO
MPARDVTIIGAGPAGVSAAVALKDRGATPLLVDRAAHVGASWRTRYDRLKLNTGRQFSHLPGRRYPKGTPTFPTRDQVIDHLDRHAREDGIDLALETTIERVEKGSGTWTLVTPSDRLETRQLVVATGYEHSPFIPDWPGRDRFGGALLHSADYRNAEPYSEQSVLVVGPGCSGMEIAHELATEGAAKVWLSVRTPPNIMLRDGPAGLPGDVISTPLYHVPIRIADAIARFGRKQDIGDLSEYGLPIPDEGIFARNARLGVAPAIVDAEVIDSIRDRSIEVVRGVESLEAGAAVLADGERVAPDAIICATGFRRGLEPMVGHLGVLDDQGRPRTVGAKPAADGLRFIGYVPRPSQIGATAKQAKRAARAIARELG